MMNISYGVGQTTTNSFSWVYHRRGIVRHYLEANHPTSINTFICNKENFSEYQSNSSFIAFDVDNKSQDSFSFPIFSNDSWYFVLSNNESVHSFKYINVTIELYEDRTPPESSAGALPQYETTNVFDIQCESNHIGGSGVESVELYSTTDNGGTWQKYGTYTSSPIQFIATKEGAHGFYTVAADFAGNKESLPVQGTQPDASTFVDLSSPTSSLAPLPEYENSSFDIAYNAADTPSGSGLDSVELFYTLDSGGTWISCGKFSSSPIHFTPVTDGGFGFCAIAADKSGNIEGKLKSIEVSTFVDTQKPTITLLYPQPGSELNTSEVTVRWQGTDSGSGIVNYSVRLDGGNHVQVSGTNHAFSGLENGSHHISLKAVDRAGNWNETSVDFNTKLPAPQTPAQQPGKKSEEGKGVSFLLVGFVVGGMVLLVLVIYFLFVHKPKKERKKQKKPSKRISQRKNRPKKEENPNKKSTCSSRRESSEKGSTEKGSTEKESGI